MLEEAQENMKNNQEIMARVQRQAGELRAWMNEHVMKMPPLPPGVRVLPSPLLPEEQKRALRDGIRMLDEASLMHIVDHFSEMQKESGLPGTVTRIEVRLGA